MDRSSSAEIACLREGVSVQSSGFALKTWPSDGMWLSMDATECLLASAESARAKSLIQKY
jgi:hypothetical protein